jgi:peptide/nickel transport system permease protein
MQRPGAQPAAAHGLRVPPILTFLARRLASLVLVVWVVEIVTFLMVHLMPGNPARNVLGPHASAGAVQALRDELGLDRPLLEQYWRYTWDALHLRFGTSFYTHLQVSAELRERIAPELELIGVSISIVLVVGIGFGIWAAALTRESRHRRLESVLVFLTGVVGSIPGYVLATLLALLFAVTFRLFPVAGTSTPASVVLPALSIALPQAALFARIVRVETLNTLAQNYVRSARSKRLRTRTVYLRYVLPNVLTAALTLGGAVFAQTIGSAIIVETVYSWNGLGLLLTQSVLHLDYPMVQAAALFLAVVVVVVNTLIDVVVSLADPRSASERGLEFG